MPVSLQFLTFDTFYTFKKKYLPYLYMKKEKDKSNGEQCYKDNLSLHTILFKINQNKQTNETQSYINVKVREKDQRKLLIKSRN